MHALHERLTAAHEWYAEWHKLPYASAVHLLGVFAFAVAFSVPIQQSLLAIHEGSATHIASSTDERVARVSEMNDRLLRSVYAFKAVASVDARQLLSEQMRVAATERRDAMVALARTNPKIFLAQALPSDVRAQMPKEIALLFEEETEIEGELEVVHSDPPMEGGASFTHYRMVGPSGKEFSVHFPELPEQALISGMRLRLNGLALGDDLVPFAALDGGTTVVSAAAGTPTSGDQRTLVLLVNFSNSVSQPWTKEQVAATVFSSTKSVNAFFKETSHGAISLSGDVVGWYTIPYTNANCDTMYRTWMTAALDAAVAAGVNPASYPRRIFMLNTPSCSWGGMGSIGGNPSWSIIDGYNDPSIIAHEFGHNLQSWHAQWLKCGSKQIDAYANCTIDEYGDRTDVMGYVWGYYFQFGGPRKLGAGWLSTEAHLQTVTQSGTYVLTPSESNDASVKVIRVPKPNTNEYYYISYRQPIGVFDATLPTALTQGALVHVWNGSLSTNTKLIDTTPGDNSALNAPLTDGRAFYDPVNGVTIAQVAHTSGSVTLEIQLGSSACVPSAPTVSLTPSTQSGEAGSTLLYTARVVNNDSAGCAPSRFTLSSSLPTLWTSTIGQPVLEVAPLASASTPLEIRIPLSSADGSYQVTLSVTDASSTVHTASTLGTAVVMSSVVPQDTLPPQVTFTSPKDGTRLRGNGSVSLSVSATDNTAVAVITISVNGALLTSCSTATTCSASFGGKSLASGTYTITASAQDAAGNSSSATIRVIK